jgi:histidinol-phosphate aminotransferase
MLAAIENINLRSFLPTPTTLKLFSEASVREIIAAAKGLVVIDEAYAPFAGASFLNSLSQYDNLLVMRTVSKLGLAGLRLGYIVGNPAIIGQLNKIRLPYNINVLTQISADFALSNKTLFDQQTQKICAERSALFKRLNEIDGITAYPSAANFILFRTPKGQANAIFASIKQQGVLIKNLSAQNKLLSDCLRVTIGNRKGKCLSARINKSLTCHRNKNHIKSSNTLFLVKKSYRYLTHKKHINIMHKHDSLYVLNYF